MYCEKYDFDPPRDKYLRRCIDGKSTNCSGCVGFCQYSGHPGYLTKELRRKHDCLNKNCFYYKPKEKEIKEPPKKDNYKSFLTFATDVVSEYEGLKITKVIEKNGLLILKYVTLSNDYPFDSLAQKISKELGQSTILVRLNCDFEEAARLVFEN